MSPKDIYAGQELAGSDGAGAEPTYFTHNMWIGLNHSYNYQSNAGIEFQSYSPPYARWISTPQGNANAGGTHCTAC
ncbi:hypothetical protein EI42_05626 [Thermosporothrix hazakensis]|jgi:hypothetical protein|uniref:Uncharacterized protein n=1 Tax=Thermosporothrix hazakensis TaxID=644383 RepID=A0A326TXJ6_THEHA|nr:hypothetical protein EI42_05626 [Thermosporothrix hazakensis]GCE50743.1 hypothetical protein KTH_56120 [Thermosporothrix hazakensis]